MAETKLSDAARELRNKFQRDYMSEYRKKNPNHMNDYWERKVAKEAQKGELITEAETCCFSKGNQSDKAYIKGLEESNRTMISESKRLSNLIIEINKNIENYDAGKNNKEYIQFLEILNKRMQVGLNGITKYFIQQTVKNQIYKNGNS